MTVNSKQCLVLLVFLIGALLAGVAAPARSAAAATEIQLVKVPYREDGSKAWIPQIQGLNPGELQTRVNTHLAAAILALKNPSPGSVLHGDFEVSFYNGLLLGVHFRGDSYTPGGARPTKIDSGVHIDLTSGKVYEIDELFKAGVDFERSIKALCTTKESDYRLSIAGLADHWTIKTFTTSWTGRDKAFLLSADSVRVYSIPSNALGPIGGYNLPYTDLADILDQDGALWRELAGRPAGSLTVIREGSR